MVSAFVSIFLVTCSVWSSVVWLGVSSDGLHGISFPGRLDRWFDGTVGKGGRAAKKLTGFKWWARSGCLPGGMFVPDALRFWPTSSVRIALVSGSCSLRFKHPIPFLVMAVSTVLLMMFNFIYFREQTCLIACPYGRFQSVMLDRRS